MSKESNQEAFSFNYTTSQQLKKSLDQLEIVKKHEKTKLKKGYKYMILGKTSLLTNPDKFKERLNEGYKFLKK